MSPHGFFRTLFFKCDLGYTKQTHAIQRLEGLPSFSNESPTSRETSQSWTNQDDIFYAYASMSPGAEHRGTTQLLPFQLAPIKKLEGSLQTHLLLSSFHPRVTFPGIAGGGEGRQAAGPPGGPGQEY
ncbi:putative uncharacterized protein FLJ45825 [Hylobates moloch]|uniref:putative uncharacterized protein FLJ45825 n=1 Tax=Hylobates moloch TaxID=81572 RepID=UPI001362FB29|nr:putative uncharacterized protein FLJ45825 [Hylobates moloch]